MPVEESEQHADTLVPTDDDKSRYLLHYLLCSRGICHESVLLLALIKLEGHSRVEDENWTISRYQDKLSEIIHKINVKLSFIGFKVVRLSHGIGRNNVVKNSTKSFEFCAATMAGFDNEDLELPTNNRFYVYIDIGSVDETKFATRFNPKEIEFIQWAVQKICMSGYEIRKGPVPKSSQVLEEVDRIRRDACEEAEQQISCWEEYASFSVGSTLLSNYQDLSALEVEDLIFRLCEYKWFCITDQGEISLDVRCIAELEQYLISTFELLSCQNCKSLAIQGVLCRHNDDKPDSMWHVDCYQHHLTHVSKDCNSCGNSLIMNGVYVI